MHEPGFFVSLPCLKKHTMILKKLYSEVKSLNEQVENIHYGGCGVFAYHAYVTLKKLGHQPKLITITNSTTRFEQFLNDLFGWYDVHVQHIVVELNGQYIDNNGIYTTIKDVLHCDKEGLAVTEALTEDTLKWMIDNLQWNSMFNREKIPVIEEKFVQTQQKLAKERIKLSARIFAKIENIL